MSTGTPLTQEEAEREAVAISIYERYSLLEEERPVIETMAYIDKYKKILDDICLDKMKLDGMNKEEEEAIIRIKGETLIKKDNPGAFVILIQLEGKINLNALVDTGLDINVILYRIYKELGGEEVKNVGVTTIIEKFLILDIPIDRDTPILVGRGFMHTCGGILNTIDNIMSTFDGICHQTFCAAKTSLDTAESDSDDEEEPTAKYVGLCVADSHTGNHPEDGFTPLETIRRLLVVIRRRSHLGFEGEAFKPERGSLLSGGDNKPPMLENHLYDSWKSRMELYMMNRTHGRMILALVEKGPLVWPTITVDGVTRPKEYTKLTPAEAIQANCDIKAINIILQGLPTKIYALEVDIIKKTENQAKMTKLSMEWKRLCKIKAKVQKCQSQSQYRRISSQTGAGTEEYY
ncbi:hypothetical protein Tco_0920193 [Tanacetum coccineum]